MAPRGLASVVGGGQFGAAHPRGVDGIGNQRAQSAGFEGFDRSLGGAVRRGDATPQLGGIDTTHTAGYWTRTSVVALKHAGEAARTWGIQPLRLTRRQDPVPVALMNTYVPFPGGVAMIAAGSPAAEIADPLFELFDAVTDTFRLHRVEGAVR